MVFVLFFFTNSYEQKKIGNKFKKLKKSPQKTNQEVWKETKFFGLIWEQ
jgi:hypothetical protein